ncbi:Copper-exporting ATPase, P-type ATPase [Alteracholeplasma palmae J233]|uniref:Copper-exporting ATPase, P-type ATPase n=1 Tax=Alteracholeplasma palmae (strain ATCC 49389 / J233) TaxID=1318466 RepID=U4KL52_ALTPJ|nr:heavy metal translocating P-type ATPase [Alteracholeplasma palmae]CCV64463.1 Copper-exporting ATPase, P-type ATPase [Alteracholeplasma palmae J233]
MRKSVKVSNITCAQCAKTIENYYKKQDGVDAKVLVSAKKVIFNYDERKTNEHTLLEGLQSIGYYPVINSEDQIKALRKDRIDLFIAVIFSIPLLWTMFAHLNIPLPVPDILMNGYFQWIITTPVQFYAGRRFYKAAYEQLKNKAFGMDVLVVIGTMAAYIYSIYQVFMHHGTSHHYDLYFETSAVIFLMVLIGNYFESRVKEKTSDSLQALMSLGAKEARIKINNETQTVLVEEVKIGDIVVVLANEKIPLDGTVVSGTSYLDESMITGESMPAFKEIGSKVVGASMNLTETLEISVSATGSDTVLSKIIQTVEETALIKPKVQRVADRIANYFVPAVIVISILVFIIQLIISKDINIAFSTSIAVLVISCPCALGLATPTSISVASGISFKKGILYKGGEFFEIAHELKAIAFDKTGTLTNGTPKVVGFYGDKSTYAYTASLEAHSNHPLALAVLEDFTDEYLEVKSFNVLLGIGLNGMINGKNIYVGSKKILDQLKIEQTFDTYETLSSEGKTVIFTIVDGILVNMIAIQDELKESAKNLILELKRRNITPYMITGDNEKTATYIASQVGIDKVFSEVLPHQKAEIIKDIQKQGFKTAFVGDGINDAPALKMADIGFAIGSGSDIAIDTSDVTLMSSSLGLVVDAIDLSKATLRNIYLNFFWAFIYNIIMIPVAAMGFINPALAGIGMGFSSIAVVLNALSLKLFKFKYKENEE